MKNRISLGWAERELPESVNQDLTGFLDRPNPCEGKRDPLYARVLYLNDGRNHAVYVSVDMLGMGQALTERIRAASSHEHNIPPRAYTFAATHTHSAPPAVFLANRGVVDRDWNRELEQVILDVITDAVMGRTKRVRLRFAQTDAPGFTYSRRTHDSDGTPRKGKRSAKAGASPDSEIDTTLSVIVANDLRTGNPVAAMVHFPANPVFYRDNLSSADYPGRLVQKVNESVGRGFRSMFIQGPCGNINPLRLSANVDEDVERMSAGLAEKAIELIRDKNAGTYLVPKINARLRYDTLPWVTTDVDEDALEKLVLSPEDWTKADLNTQADHVWAKRVLVTRSRGWWIDGVRVPIGVTMFGELILVAAPGEIFSETIERLRAAHPDRMFIGVGHANDDVGYIPSTDAYTKGGLGLETMHRVYGYSNPVSPKAEEVILTTVEDVLNVGTMAIPEVK
ncbi:MAG TPA: hypothetical protein ENN56_00375 [Firmicutes bacterium]|nr:hypothetical protein [Bacillota bacterium]